MMPVHTKPEYLLTDDVNADEDYAVITVFLEEEDGAAVFVDKIVNGTPNFGSIDCGGIFSACNGHQAEGFTSPGRTLNIDPTHNGQILMSFSHRRHSAIRTGNSTTIFIPTHYEIMHKRRANSAKQFAAYITNNDEDDFFSGVYNRTC